MKELLFFWAEYETSWYFTCTYIPHPGQPSFVLCVFYLLRCTVRHVMLISGLLRILLFLIVHVYSFKNLMVFNILYCLFIGLLLKLKYSYFYYKQGIITLLQFTLRIICICMKCYDDPLEISKDIKSGKGGTTKRKPSA